MYSFESRVRYSETASDGKLSMLGVLNYMQDCSFFQSESLGLGIEYLKEKKRAWFISSWQIEVIRRPEHGEKIKIGTWPTGFRAMYGYRNFVIIGEDGEIAVKAYSIWVYLNTETGKPYRVDKTEIEKYGEEPALPMETGDRKIDIPENLERKGSRKARRYQIDTNGHVNNAMYYQMAADYLPGDGQIGKLRIEYRKAAMYHEMITPAVAETENETTVALLADDGTAYAVVQTKGI